ncbi:MAG: sodium:solute symporter family protein [Planctomycetota bacterium]
MAYRKRASRGPVEYFLAGRQTPGWKAGLSMAATQYAADTPLLFTGLIATGGVCLLWRFWIYGFGYLLIAFVFAECWRRANVLTDAELAEVRYSGRGVLFLRGLKAVYYGGVVNCLFLAMVLTAAVRVAEVFAPWHEWLPASVYDPILAWVTASGLKVTVVATGIDPTIAAANGFLSVAVISLFVLAYSAVGGLRAVIATDVVQFGLMTVGTIAYAGCVLSEVGGLGGMSERLTALYGEVEHARLVAVLPTESGALLPFMMLIGIQGLFWIGSDGTGYLAQRYMACRTDQDARTAGVLVTWVQFLGRSLVWLVIGVGLLVVYPFTPADVGAADFAASRELTFVKGIEDLMPVGLRGVMLAAMLAALGSTIDSHLSWGSAYWTNDLYGRLLCRGVLRRRPHRRELVAVARVSSVAVLLISTFLMTRIGSIQATWLVSLVFGAGIGGVLMLRWVWSRTNVYSELVAIAGSLVLAPLSLLWFEEEWLQMAFVAGSCVGLAIVAAWVTRPTSAKRLERFAATVRPFGLWPETERGDPRRRALVRLYWTVVMSASLFCLLTGTVRLLLPPPGAGPTLGLALTVAGVVLGVVSAPALRAETFDEQEATES